MRYGVCHLCPCAFTWEHLSTSSMFLSYYPYTLDDSYCEQIGTTTYFLPQVCMVNCRLPYIPVYIIKHRDFSFKLSLDTHFIVFQVVRDPLIIREPITLYEAHVRLT